MSKEITGGHVFYVCDGESCDIRTSCWFCDGGLSSCTRCGAAEGAWPDECPGVRMTADQSEAVYAGQLNYRDGAWREGECCQVMRPAREVGDAGGSPLAEGSAR